MTVVLTFKPKKQTMLRYFTLLFIHLFVLHTSTSYAQSARLQGKVIDELGLAMPGATIKLEGSQTRMTISDQTGRFVFQGLSNGKTTITVSYIGYQAKSQTIDVSSSTNEITIQLEEASILGNEIIVLGDRLKGQAKALNQQRTNANITNVVAADQIGRFPDSNIGDAMKRIPGITMQNDQGEARNIIIRGLSAGLNSVTLNGERIPSAEGDNRNVQMDLIPADMIQTIEVNKAVLPNMDADAIGGSVNLVTRSASDGLRVSSTIGSGINLLSDKPMSNFSLVLGNRFLDKKLGVVLSSSYNNHIFGSDNFEGVWVETANPAYPVVLSGFDLRKYDVQRVRRSASLATDYKIAKGHTIFLNAMYNWRDDRENRYRFRVDRLNTPVVSGSFKELAENILELRGRVAIQTKGGIDNDRNQNTRLEDQRVANVTLAGEDLFGALKMTWSGTYAKALEDRPNERYITHRSNAQVVVNTQDPAKYLVTLVDQNAALGLGLNEIYESNNNTNETDYNGRIDFELPFSANKNKLKFGGRYRYKDKIRTNSYDIYESINGLTAAGNKLGALPTSVQNERVFLNGPQYVPGVFVTNSYLGGLDLGNASLFEKEDAIGEYITSNYNAKEQIFAGYVMTDLRVSDKLTGSVGLRLESTSVDYQGYTFDEDEEVATQTPVFSKQYTNLLPGAHARYQFTENAILKAAWTNTLARPGYFSLVPFAAYSPDNQTLEQGNPNLEATTSSNFDVMYENYFASVGLVSFGGFYKDIKNFIYTQTALNVNDPRFGQLVSSTRPENGGTARVSGLEIALQRQLDFLPGVLKGLGIYTNYTFTQSTTTGIEGRENETIALPGTAKHMLNASLSYENKKLVVRASLNYASDYVDVIGSSQFNDVYYDRQTFLDVNASYAFSKNLRVYLEANNLTNQPLRYYQGVRVRTYQEEFYNARIGFGVKYDLFGK